MTSVRSKTGLPAGDPGERNAPRENSAQDQSAPGAVPDAKAFSELLSRGAEEIQDHLSLVALIQVQIGHLLETSIEELERAQRLETLTGLIAGESGKDRPGPNGGPALGDTAESPSAYLEREIRSLKKMQKLLGVKPRSPEESDPEAAHSEPASNGEGEADDGMPKRILIINHDPGTVRILRYFLEKEDYEVLASSNGLDGLRKAVEARPDAILLDILLSGMDGYQVLGRLKKNSRTARIPVFVMSVLAQEVDILKAIEGGAADYFTKPFSPHIIIAKVRRALKARHE
jgi:CheY-like chemotaxis protein